MFKHGFITCLNTCCKNLLNTFVEPLKHSSGCYYISDAIYRLELIEIEQNYLMYYYGKETTTEEEDDDIVLQPKKVKTSGGKPSVGKVDVPTKYKITKTIDLRKQLSDEKIVDRSVVWR